MTRGALTIGALLVFSGCSPQNTATAPAVRSPQSVAASAATLPVASPGASPVASPLVGPSKVPSTAALAASPVGAWERSLPGNQVYVVGAKAACLNDGFILGAGAAPSFEAVSTIISGTFPPARIATPTPLPSGALAPTPAPTPTPTPTPVPTATPLPPPTVALTGQHLVVHWTDGRYLDLTYDPSSDTFTGTTNDFPNPNDAPASGVATVTYTRKVGATSGCVELVG